MITSLQTFAAKVHSLASECHYKGLQNDDDIKSVYERAMALHGSDLSSCEADLEMLFYGEKIADEFVKDGKVDLLGAFRHLVLDIYLPELTETHFGQIPEQYQPVISDARRTLWGAEA